MNEQTRQRLLAEGYSHRDAYILSTENPLSTYKRLQKLERDMLEDNLPPDKQKRVDDLRKRLRGE